MKFHVSLNVSDIARSVEFYRTLLGIEPAKRKIDYAKFELEDPALILSLVPVAPSTGGTVNHVGLRVPGSPELVAIQARLEAVGIRTQREEGVACCYSTQTKFWVKEPDGTLWEMYVLHQDIAERGNAAPTPPADSSVLGQPVPRAQTVFHHRLGEPIPDRIPHEDNSVHEVQLQGTLNAPPSLGDPAHLLREAFRALRPGGVVGLHTLAADADLNGAPLDLPGPASVVRKVPVESELLEMLRQAGFVEARFDVFSEKPCFLVEGVPLRETRLAARKPGYRPQTAAHVAIYRGPLAEVKDDFGNVFPRGRQVHLNIQDWQALKQGSGSSHFLLLAPEDAPAPGCGKKA